MLWLSELALAFPYPVQTETLDNGLELVVIEMQSPGVVASQLRLSVGSRNEIDAGRSGFAHFFEHLMFSDSERMTRVEREQTLLELGARDGAWTSLDQTNYHAIVPTASVPAYLEVVAGSFAGLQLTPEAVRKEAGAVYGEWRKSSADPDRKVYDALYGTAYTVHPYEHDVIGHVADIREMPSAYEYAQVFAHRWYRPENARLYLAGDVTLEQARTWAEPFAAWQPEPLEEVPPIPEEPPQEEERREVIESPVGSPRIVFAWKVPPARMDEDTAALWGVQALLFGAQGRLQNRLVREEAVATAVWGGHDERVDTGLFTIFVRARDVAALERIEAIVDEEVARLGSDPPAEVLGASKERGRYQTLSGLDQPQRVIGEVASRLLIGGTVDALDARDELFAAVDTAAIQRAISTWFVPTGRTVITLRPPAETE